MWSESRGGIQCDMVRFELNVLLAHSPMQCTKSQRVHSNPSLKTISENSNMFQREIRTAISFELPVLICKWYLTLFTVFIHFPLLFSHIRSDAMWQFSTAITLWLNRIAHTQHSNNMIAKSVNYLNSWHKKNGI